MAISNPVRDEPGLSDHFATETLERFPSTFSSDLTIDALLTPPAERFTGSLAEIDPLLDDSDELLDDEERGDSTMLEEAPRRSRSGGVTSTKHASASEDAFQSYLRDIRGLGLLTHEQEVDLARRAAAGDEQARRKLIESNLRL